MPTNFEFKARVPGVETLEKRFLELMPRFVGEDRQIDTYFNVPEGRLKLRQGKIENALIFYRREDIKGAKQSDVTLYEARESGNLKIILEQALGIRQVVDKTRKIYFIENVKFHFDQVTGLGSFIEVEAIDHDDTITLETLRRQCTHYAEFFGLKEEDFVKESYGEMRV